MPTTRHGDIRSLIVVLTRCMVCTLASASLSKTSHASSQKQLAESRVIDLRNELSLGSTDRSPPLDMRSFLQRKLQQDLRNQLDCDTETAQKSRCSQLAVVLLEASAAPSFDQSYIVHVVIAWNRIPLDGRPSQSWRLVRASSASSTVSELDDAWRRALGRVTRRVTRSLHSGPVAKSSIDATQHADWRKQAHWSAQTITPSSVARAHALRSTRPKHIEASSIRRGSAVVVHPDGFLLTAYHVVRNARSVSVRLTGERRVDATVLQVDQRNDLALLKVPITGLDYLSLSPSSKGQLGQYVFTIGFPAVDILGTPPRFTEGSVSALYGPLGAEHLIQISVPIQPGNSGGPLINRQGQVEGIITSTAQADRFHQTTGSLPQRVNFATKVQHLWPIIPNAPAQQPAANRQEAIERAIQATCLIEVRIEQ